MRIPGHVANEIAVLNLLQASRIVKSTSVDIGRTSNEECYQWTYTSEGLDTGALKSSP
jgi:hypothetical protein